MLKQKEKLLQQGHSNEEVVKIGNTVHRSLNKNSEYIHKLLLLLEEKGFQYSPRFLGIDDKGREILTFLEGDIARGDINWTDEQLLHITKMIKDLHNNTEGSNLAQNEEVVCHNDLAPWNLVIQGSKPIGFIDFDDATPGSRIDDISYFLWTFLDLGKSVSVEKQARKIKIVSEEYGGFKPEELINAILGQQERILKKRKYLSEKARTDEEREFSREKIVEIKSEIKWIEDNREAILKILKS